MPPSANTRNRNFSVLLIAAALSVIGIALMPKLRVQAEAETPQRSISVGVGLAGASAKTIEAEVTSRIEGVLANVSGVTDMSSVSREGSGTISLSFAKGTDMQVARFEVSSQIRAIWPSLPDGSSYPSISLAPSGRKAVTAISYVIKSPMPSREIAVWIDKYMLPRLSMIPGVERVSVNGDTPYHYEIEFDSKLTESLGISAQEISIAFNAAHYDDVIGLVRQDGRTYEVRMKSGLDGSDFNNIPIKKVSGRIIHLGDIAEWRFCESDPTSYFRLNGLNTITLSFDISNDVNMISITDDIRKSMDEIGKSFPEGMSATVGHDASQYMRREIRRIITRTALCLLLLLAFVLLASRSWRYLILITVTLAVNILVSMAMYAFTGIRIHAYTLAGITVSLGIIIDTSIVMADHWKRSRDRTVFPALFGAALTTVASLAVIFFLPDSEKARLSDFAAVIIINLSVSLLCAWYLVPALMAYFPVRESRSENTLKHRRAAAKWIRRYSCYITWGSRHRAMLVALAVAAFGIPTFLLPDFANIRDRKYTKVAEKVLGSSFGLFHRSLSRANFYRVPQERVLHITAGMPDGCNVGQLDEIIRKMENYLSQFDEIDRYITNVWSYENASIDVHFKPEAASGWFPFELKRNVTSLAMSYGGATWQISGIDSQSFNNNVITRHFSNTISLSGYNYDDLLAYADILIQEMSGNRRISNPQIWSSDNRDSPETEVHVDYDYGHMTAIGANPYRYYSALSRPLFSSRIGSILHNGSHVGVDLLSSERESMDVWHITNTSVTVDSLNIKMSDIGHIGKQMSSIPIRKRNQSYYVNVKYDYIGNFMQSDKTGKALVAKMNKEILPMGFRASTPSQGWFNDSRNKYAGIILLIVVIIFIICSVLFESLKLPLAVILMIPISFIGEFLAFGWTKVPFDQGGFVAFVMLSGLVVNAAIYLISEWQAIRLKNARRAYLKAFSHKIWPICLTVISTVLGLIPFLMDGPQDVFWFDFALGTISGLLFSMIAIVLYLPIFVRSI